MTKIEFLFSENTFNRVEEINSEIERIMCNSKDPEIDRLMEMSGEELFEYYVKNGYHLPDYIEIQRFVISFNSKTFLQGIRDFLSVFYKSKVRGYLHNIDVVLLLLFLKMKSICVSQFYLTRSLGTAFSSNVSTCLLNKIFTNENKKIFNQFSFRESIQILN